MREREKEKKEERGRYLNEAGRSMNVDVHMLLEDGDELSCLLYAHIDDLQRL